MSDEPTARTPRSIPTVERTECAICRRPVDLARTIRSTALFEPGRGDLVHRCPDEALIVFRRAIMLRRWGDPRETRLTKPKNQ